jgi:hypothetical protein
MNDETGERGADLSVEPETMLAIRNGVREQLVRKVHALRITARLHQRFGNREMARKQEERIEQTLMMIKALEDEMSRPGSPQPVIDFDEDVTEA